MTYSCGYWRSARTLEEAQRDKMDLICQKLLLRPGMRILDIGCGWGALAAHAARHYGAEVVGITLSEPQRQWAEAACQGLPVTFRLQDYRDLPPDTFDRIVSVGMFEHVGHRNHRTFMGTVRKHLSGDGLALVHTIGGNRTQAGGDPWIHKYIFPNGEIPSTRQITRAIDGHFILEDWHNLGADYDRTLMAWHANFLRHWPELESNYGSGFFRMWTYYLLSCAGAFRARNLQVWQTVLTPHGLPGGFPVREFKEGTTEDSRDVELLDPALEVS
jgi:cyclopropane-fatty-acyl-phospholipid synthase